MKAAIAERLQNKLKEVNQEKGEKDKKKEDKQCCTPWSQCTMTCQILTVLIVTFLGFFLLQVLFLEISSRNYRLRLSSEITGNFEATHEDIINPLKADSLSTTFLSYIEAREQLLAKVADLLAEVLSKN